MWLGYRRGGPLGRTDQRSAARNDRLPIAVQVTEAGGVRAEDEKAASEKTAAEAHVAFDLFAGAPTLAMTAPPVESRSCHESKGVVLSSS